MTAADLMEECRQAVRDGGHILSAYRLGMEVGSRGLDLACPYSNPRSSKLYREGMRYGRDCAKARAATADRSKP